MKRKGDFPSRLKVFPRGVDPGVDFPTETDPGVDFPAGVDLGVGFPKETEPGVDFPWGVGPGCGEGVAEARYFSISKSSGVQCVSGLLGVLQDTSENGVPLRL